MKTIIKRAATRQTLPLFVCGLVFLLAIHACSDDNPRISRTADAVPVIFPDYADVTIPPNIAPLYFRLEESCLYEKAFALFEHDGVTEKVFARNGQFAIAPRKWKKLLEHAAGKTIRVTLTARINKEWVQYPAFSLNVAHEPIDPYIAYRLIEPGYEVWNEMGIYQRNVGNFNESAIVVNSHTEFNCLNCHSFCMNDPEKMMFHYRAAHAGTMLLDGRRIEKLNTKTPQTLSTFTYPAWHPSGKFIAFSVNNIKQAFHTSDRNRIEVFDLASDVVVYDIDRHEVITTPALFSPNAFETFPAFSPDGKTLYFCTADSVPTPQHYDSVRYNLCAIAFDPQTRAFGPATDTLVDARSMRKSVSFPRVSPDGHFLMFTLSGYGNFSIWHKDADLYLIRPDSKQIISLDSLNSCDTESYHAWSSNSRWVVFSSRRIDGLYTRPFFAYIHSNGQAAKPFVLPQKNVAFYTELMKSYNIPEFISGKVRENYAFSRKAISEQGVDVRFVGYK